MLQLANVGLDERGKGDTSNVDDTVLWNVNIRISVIVIIIKNTANIT